MFLYEGIAADVRKAVTNESYDYGEFGKTSMMSPPKSDLNGNFETLYEGEHFLDEYEKRPREPKLNLGKIVR